VRVVIGVDELVGVFVPEAVGVWVSEAVKVIVGVCNGVLVYVGVTVRVRVMVPDGGVWVTMGPRVDIAAGEVVPVIVIVLVLVCIVVWGIEGEAVMEGSGVCVGRLMLTSVSCAAPASMGIISAGSQKDPVMVQAAVNSFGDKGWGSEGGPMESVPLSPPRGTVTFSPAVKI
jgi:hypothetical protein